VSKQITSVLPPTDNTQHNNLRTLNPVLRHGVCQSSLPPSQSLHCRYCHHSHSKGYCSPRISLASPPIQHRPWLHYPNYHHVTSLAALSHAAAEDVRDPNLASLPSVDATHPVVPPEHGLQIPLHRNFGETSTQAPAQSLQVRIVLLSPSPHCNALLLRRNSLLSWPLYGIYARDTIAAAYISAAEPIQCREERFNCSGQCTVGSAMGLPDLWCRVLGLGAECEVLGC